MVRVEGSVATAKASPLGALAAGFRGGVVQGAMERLAVYLPGGGS